MGCNTLSETEYIPIGQGIGGRIKQQCYAPAVLRSMRGTVQTIIQPTRLTADERGTIQRAAQGQTMSAFIRNAALNEAARVLRQGSA